MSTPEIDVIIPTRDYGRFLGQAIESALAQAQVDVLVTVLDAASSDDTEQVVARFDPRAVRYHRFEQAVPLGLSRNTGLSMTSRPFVAFLDADDILPADRSHHLLKVLRSSHADYVHGVSRTFQDPHPPDTGPHGYIAGPAPGNLLFLRTCFDRVGLFDEGVAYLSLSEWLLRAAAAGLTAATTEAVVVQRRLHSANMSRQVGKREAALALVRKHIAATNDRSGAPRQ